MHSFIEILQWTLIIFGLLYGLLISLFTAGWFQIKKSKKSKKTPDIRLSIIIPFRNEYPNLPLIFNDLIQQSYPSSNTEILLIDDHSEDGGDQEVLKLINKHKLETTRLFSLTDSYGKKAAIRKGVQKATGELIITTDADCRIGPDWIKSIVDCYSQANVKLICGPVAYHEEKNSFQKMQSLEYSSLIASGAGSIGAALPIMCSGANLAFAKSSFLKLLPYSENDKYASGDDQFLLFRTQKYYGSKAIHFLKDKRAIVYTNASTTLGGFVRQRLRWGSKSKAYESVFAKLSAVVVFLFNMVITVCFIAGFWNPDIFFMGITAILYKTAVEIILLYNFLKFLNKNQLLCWLLPVQLIYPFYISVIGFLSLFSLNKWKGRNIK